jgi:hypothetical protein
MRSGSGSSSARFLISSPPTSTALASRFAGLPNSAGGADQVLRIGWLGSRPKSPLYDRLRQRFNDLIGAYAFPRSGISMVYRRIGQ